MEPITRLEQYLNAILRGDTSNLPKPITREEIYLYTIAVTGGGGGGTSDYSELQNKPSINGVQLSGNKSGTTLGLVNAEAGKGLSTEDFTSDEKTKLGNVQTSYTGTSTQWSNLSAEDKAKYKVVNITG